MNILPTVEGGLRIEVESATDWIVLENIALDALDGGTGKLPSRLSALMDDDSDWEEMVIPELKEFFTEQLRKVADTVRQAQRESTDPPEGKVFIMQADGLEWYGALNQARLALESRHKFGPIQDIEDLDSFPAPKRSAFIRSQV